MKNKLLFVFALISSTVFSQNVAINATGAAPVASAMLDITSTTSGFLMPRMTSVQRVAIAAPATGLKVYDTTTNSFWFFNGVIWVEQLATNNGWALAGNTLAGTEILGSVNAQPVRFFSNNTERLRLTSAGYLGIQTTAPSVWIHFIPPSTIGNFQTMWDNTLANDAMARFQHTQTANGSRVLLSVTNYNASAFQTPALMGLSLQTLGTGAVGVQGVANGPGQTGVYCGNQNATAVTTGWGLYSNNWAGGVTAWQNVSDERLKKNIVTISNATSKIKQLRGVEYFFDTDKYDDINLPTEKQYGFIAQEVEKILPEIVREAIISGNQNKKANNSFLNENKDYQFKVLSYTYIIPLLVETAKEQDAKIQALEKEILELKELIRRK
ncbi:MAG: tail fiber domain-containing protein [Bacteroidetes bacterium]|nr:tail fiber domain-containing protein [Bacteroidota bacterium]